MITEAIKFAIKCHEGQIRKFTGKAYITHPLRVAYEVAALSDSNDDMMVAAILHDVAEDCGVSIDALYPQFGLTVTILVSELTNPSKQYPHLSRAEKKKMDRDHLSKVSVRAQIIKLIDRIDNIQEMSLAPDDFYFLYLEESLLLHQVIGHADEVLGKKLLDLINKSKEYRLNLNKCSEDGKQYRKEHPELFPEFPADHPLAFNQEFIPHDGTSI